MNPFHPSPQRKSHPALSAQELDATEGLIEQALHTLRDAQPKAGMEDRLLAMLEHRSGPPPNSLRERFFSRSPQLAMGAGMVLALALLVMVPLRIHRHAITSASTASASTTATEEAAAGNAVPFFRKNAGNREETSPETPPPERALRHAPRRSLESASFAPDSASLPSIDNSDALALAELHAPSRPAPPLPLASQERVLLRLAHHPRQVEITALDPIERASLTDRELADFHHFFYRPLLPQPTVSPAVSGETNAQ